MTSEGHNRPSVSETTLSKVRIVIITIVVVLSPPVSLSRCVFAGVSAGQCACKEGFEGRRCDRCAFGYRDFPQCARCECDLSGSTNTDPCSPCTCKVS